MKNFAKIKYIFLSFFCSLKLRYDTLTKNSAVMHVSFLMVFIFLFMLLYSQTLKWETYKQERKIENLNKTITKLNDDVFVRDSLITSYNDKHQIIKEFVKEIYTTSYYQTSLTGYHPVREQTDSTPDITADGTKFDIDRAGDYRYVALSRDLLRHFNRRGADIQFGDYILIKGTPNGEHDGIYQVRDTMNKRHTEWIDILLTPGQKSFYYRNILMSKITKEEYIYILKEIYDELPEIQPIAMVEPEVKMH